MYYGYYWLGGKVTSTELWTFSSFSDKMDGVLIQLVGLRVGMPHPVPAPAPVERERALPQAVAVLVGLDALVADDADGTSVAEGPVLSLSKEQR